MCVGVCVVHMYVRFCVGCGMWDVVWCGVGHPSPSPPPCADDQLTPNDEDPVAAVTTGSLLGEKDERMIELKIHNSEPHEVCLDCWWWLMAVLSHSSCCVIPSPLSPSSPPSLPSPPCSRLLRSHGTPLLMTTIVSTSSLGTMSGSTPS